MDILAPKHILSCMNGNTAFPPPQVRQVWFSEARDRFSLPVEQYREWVLLGLRSGSYRFALGKGKSQICRAGEWVLCPPGVELHRAALERVSFYFIRFQWKPASPDFWKGKKNPGDPVRLESTLEHLRRRMGLFGHANCPPWIHHLVADLFYQCLEEARVPGQEKIPDRLMLKAAAWVREHLEESRSLEELAAKLRLSPFQLSRRFRAAWGINPAAYRTRLRIDKARSLLLETDWTTERVAGACGFENAFYFSRVFAGQTGQPPREFRKAHRV
jgi:AraC-like DNA-binding protein